jgi:hypothetical protein
VPIETQTVDPDAHEHVEATAVELKLSHDGAIRVLLAEKENDRNVPWGLTM